ncbi:YdeI/OmpD-associated family protein [Actinophytocola sp.]|uniref:YdeI/OmpD-associated family protein n=1 Tax=Actinophytocola sp. TaxID=1872138 RepID=UPI002ED588D4
MELVVANTVAEWRAWLARNCRSATEAWLVIQHKHSGKPSSRVHEAVEQALCFGWIDGLHRKRDADSSQLRFTPRRPSSTWSALNRERATRLTTLGLMTPAGQAMIDLAKATGRWEVPVPEDIRALLEEQPSFHRLPPSRKRLTLEWIATAKRPETRQRRLEAALQGGGPL